MKKLYPYAFFLVLLFSCSKEGGQTDNGEDPLVTNVKACFSLTKNNVLVGESLEITNCSSGATTYSYNLGNGETRTEANPTVVYGKAGDYSISLTASNEQEETDIFSQQIEVIEAVAEDFFFFPEIASGFQVIPLEIGINPNSNSLYGIFLEEDLEGSGGKKFYYHEIDDNYNSTKQYLADKPFESGSAFVEYYSNSKNFVFTRTLDGLYGSQEVTYNEGWAFMNGVSPADKLSYGSISEGVNYLYYGTQEDGGVYKTAIETRNSSGDAFQVSLNAFGPADSMLGDLLPYGTGYIGFGAVFSKNVSNPKITSYKPLLVFFDSAFQVISHKIYEESVLSSIVNSSNDLNGSYHLTILNNGNIAMYANGELVLADPEGNLLKIEYFENSSNIQGLVGLGDSFVLSSYKALRKYDSSGTVLNSINYPGNFTPEIVEIEENLFFIAGYELDGKIALLYGQADKNLNLININ